MPVRFPLVAPASITSIRSVASFASIASMVLTALMASALAGCASTPALPAGVDFVVVRHAEKSADDPRDPALTAAGRARAQRLAESLAQAPLVAAYATPLQRTQQTAAPSATAHGLAVTTYGAATDASVLADRLRRSHPRGTVLVVGHSNTVPAIAAALCGCTVAPIDDAQYGRRLTVHVDAAGRATFDERVDP